MHFEPYLLYSRSSSIAITAAICVVIGIVATIYVLRYLVLPESSAQTIASVCNSVQIQITNYLYTLLANALTEVGRCEFTGGPLHQLTMCCVPHLTADGELPH